MTIPCGRQGVKKIWTVGKPHNNEFYEPASYILYLSDFCRFLLCTCGWERRGGG
jgi:hypothetical protein